MSKRQLLEARDEYYGRVKVVCLAVSLAIADDMDDDLIIAGIRRPRVHAFWMSPYLRDRRNPQQRNTLAKLETDFIRVSIQILHSYHHKTESVDF